MDAAAPPDDPETSELELEDGTRLAVVWRSDGESGGAWVARDPLPASAVAVDVPPMRTDVAPDGLYEGVESVQDLADALLGRGLHVFHRISDEERGGRTRSRSALLTDYRRWLRPTEVGSNGVLHGLTYGRPGESAGGFANLTTLVAEVLGSEDPANEIGGTIASLQVGKGLHSPPTATLWGSSFTLRGPVDRRPGGLMGYTAVIQNYFNGSGSRSINYGYAALTRPGIGDGADFHDHDQIRLAKTFTVDVGFIVCGDSGPYPEGGQIGFDVAFQAGGHASPWATPDEWRSKIGTGLVVRDWVWGGIHIEPPHPHSGARPHVRLDRAEHQVGNLFEVRTEDGSEELAGIRHDGRVFGAPSQGADDLVTRAQLIEEVGALREELAKVHHEMRGLDARLTAVQQQPVPTGVAGVSSASLGKELGRRVPSVGRRAARGTYRRVRRLGARVLSR